MNLVVMPGNFPSSSEVKRNLLLQNKKIMNNKQFLEMQILETVISVAFLIMYARCFVAMFVDFTIRHKFDSFLLRSEMMTR